MSEITTGQPIPECDEFGDYAAKQCKNGTLYVFYLNQQLYNF
jgi:hypothetical protein